MTATDDRTPAERRGYPLPPWAAEPYLAGIAPTAADVLEWLLKLVDPAGLYPLREPAGVRQAEAYLDAWLDRHRQAQDTASRCILEDHATAVDELADLRTELLDARAAVRDAYNAGHSAGVELAAARQYVDGHLPDDVIAVLEVLPLELAVADEAPAAVKCPSLCPCDTSS